MNEKIEGFFDICAKRGLTGDQGVIIPRSNTRHLMLKRDVVEAVRAGAFHLHAIDTVDEGCALLSDMEAGERDADGAYPPGSLNQRVEERLLQFAEERRAFKATPEEGASQE